jgi:hypothetical protein
MGWASPHDQQQVYATALADLMRDLLAAIGDQGHTPRVTAADGLAALRLAASASVRPDANAA